MMANIVGVEPTRPWNSTCRSEWFSPNRALVIPSFEPAEVST